AWNRKLQRELTASLEADGHVTGPYFEIENPPELDAGLRLEFRTPGYSWGYANVQSRSAIVGESHSLKSYRTQVWAHYDLMRRAIELACRDAAGLMRAVETADREVARARRFFLHGEFSGKTQSYPFRGLAVRREKSPITGDWAYTFGAKPAN